MPTKISPVGSSASGGGSIGPTTPTNFTEGSVIFAGASTLDENNTAFLWDDTNTQLKLTAGAATKTPLALKRAAAQSADILQVFSSDGTTQLLGITSDGHTIRGNSVNQKIVLDSALEASIQYNSTNRFRCGGSAVLIQFGAGRVINFDEGGSGFRFAPNANDTDIGATGSPFANLFFAKYAEMTEMTAPSAPSTNQGRLYLEDNGSGKTRLMIRFATGAAQQIAIEP